MIYVKETDDCNVLGDPGLEKISLVTAKYVLDLWLVCVFYKVAFRFR